MKEISEELKAVLDSAPPRRVAAHRWTSPRGIGVGNWRDGDYDPRDREERRMMENGYALTRIFYDGHDIAGLRQLWNRLNSGPKWRGICKLTEECGEVLQLLGKLGAFPEGPHPDGKGPIRGRLEYEMGDLYAALDYFMETNAMDHQVISERRGRKFAQFCEWGLEGTTP